MSEHPREKLLGTLYRFKVHGAPLNNRHDSILVEFQSKYLRHCQYKTGT